jgi:uncharacterized protein (DUF433 family)
MPEQNLDALIAEHLASDPAICGGQVCIKGTRIPASLILGALAGGDTIDDLLRGYPGITRQDVAAVLAYGARLATERIVPLAKTS